ncbi:MAG: radical SAM protein [Sulfolobales archaeon]
MGKCSKCGKKSNTISELIGLCSDCLRTLSNIPTNIVDLHKKARDRLGLPSIRREAGIFRCGICVNNCYLGKDLVGYCGNYVYDNGLKTVLNSFNISYGSWYYDLHPTNCVAFPVCPAITGRGFPKYSLGRNGERGYYNLAVFYASCSLNCLYCQNWRGREDSIRFKHVMSVDEVVKAALNEKVTCVCYFGGDPTPNIIHALTTSRKIMRSLGGGRILRICWETNGTLNPRIMEEVTKISLDSGGIVKIDLKAWSSNIYQVLTGVNAIERVKENIRLVSSYMNLRDDPPLLVVSVLLVPGYVDIVEIRGIAEFLVSLNDEIPVVLLAFRPDFILKDLPPTGRKHMHESIKVMKEAGLKNVFVGNEWLLGDHY